MVTPMVTPNTQRIDRHRRKVEGRDRRDRDRRIPHDWKEAKKRHVKEHGRRGRRGRLNKYNIRIDGSHLKNEENDWEGFLESFPPSEFSDINSVSDTDEEYIKQWLDYLDSLDLHDIL